MRNYFDAFTEIIKSWIFIIFFVADALGYISNLFGFLTFQPVVYIYILLTGIVLSSVRLVALRNTKIKSLQSIKKARLRFNVENPQADNKPLVLENPERPHTSNQLNLVVYNDNEHVDAERLEVRLKWPLEGFTVLDLWDATGNNSNVWKSINNEKVYSQNETVYAGKKREVGLTLIKRFDGEVGKIKYELNAVNANSVSGEITIKKVVDPNYLGM